MRPEDECNDYANRTKWDVKKVLVKYCHQVRLYHYVHQVNNDDIWQTPPGILALLEYLSWLGLTNYYPYTFDFTRDLFFLSALYYEYCE